MNVSLDHLPFDVLFYVALNLHLDDVIHLAQTCRQLKALLDEKTLCRSVVEVRLFTMGADIIAEHQNRHFHIPKKLDWHVSGRYLSSKPSMQYMIGVTPWLKLVLSQLAPWAKQTSSYFVKA
jgi:hypothetical protein